jgi:hypothetical protein
MEISDLKHEPNIGVPEIAVVKKRRGRKPKNSNGQNTPTVIGVSAKLPKGNGQATAVVVAPKRRGPKSKVKTLVETIAAAVPVKKTRKQRSLITVSSVQNISLTLEKSGKQLFIVSKVLVTPDLKLLDTLRNLRLV